MKVARTVREEAGGKGLFADTTCDETGRSTEENGTSPSAYFIKSHVRFGEGR